MIRIEIIQLSLHCYIRLVLLKKQIIYSCSQQTIYFLSNNIQFMGGIESVCSGDKGQSNQKMVRIKSLERELKKERTEKKQLQDKIQQFQKTLITKSSQLEKVKEKVVKNQLQESPKTIRKQQNYSIQVEKTDEEERKRNQQIWKKKIDEQELKIKQLEKLVKQKDKKSQELENQLQRLKRTNQELDKRQQDQQIISKKVKEYETKIQSFQSLLKVKEQQSKELEDRLKELEQKDEELERRQQNLQSVICSLRDELQITKKREEEEEQRYQSILTQLRQTIKSLEDDKQKISSEIIKIKKELQQKQQKLDQNTKHSQEQKQQNKRSLDELTKNCRRYENEVKQKDQKIRKLYEQIQSATKNKQNQRNSRKQNPVNELKQKLDNYISELDRVRLSRNRMSRAVAEMKYSNFFNVELLQDENDYKQFLVSAIEARMHKKITKTKLIYKYDELNKLNIHKYIDNKYFIVLVVKLQNGYFLATFSEGPFYPKMQSKYDGLIISLTNRRVFVPLVKNKRAIAYDDFFVIFGNSEVRLKSQEKKLFSNFAISNGYYNANGEKVNILLGTNTREVGLESYEFYELTFK